MSIPELPYNISFPEEAFNSSLRRLNILIDNICSNFAKPIEELRSDPDKGHERMVAQIHERNQKMLKIFKLPIQPQTVPVSDVSLFPRLLPKIFSVTSFLSQKRHAFKTRHR